MQVENQMVHAALVASNAGTFEWRITDRTLKLSPGLEMLFGFPPGGFDGRIDSLLDILYPLDRDRVLEKVLNLPRDQKDIASEVRIYGSAGLRWFAWQGELQRNEYGQPGLLIGVAQEIPPLVIAERRMRAQQSLLFELLANNRIDNLPLTQGLQKITESVLKNLEVARVGIWHLSDDRKILRCLDLFTSKNEQHEQGAELFSRDYPGYFAALHESRVLAVSYAPTDYRTKELNNNYLQVLGITSMMEATLRRGGETVGVVCCEHIGPHRNWALDEQHFAASVADMVTLLMEAEESRNLLASVRHQSEHDSLTGLLDRHGLCKQLEVFGNAEPKQPFALFMLDLDQFKEINDSLGHAIGDRLLVQLAERLKASVSEQAILARMGGDEFGILFPGEFSPDELLMQGELLKRTIREPADIEGARLSANASIGISLYPDHSEDVYSLLRFADIALYQAKERNGVEIYHASKDKHSTRKLKLMHDLILAVHDQKIDVVYQPKISVAGNVMVGMEALARWHHPEFGDVGPDEFIKLAEMSGLIQDLTLTVLKRACGDWKMWQAQGLDVPVAVNLSPNLLNDELFVLKLIEAVRASNVPMHRIEFEITEGAFMYEPKVTIANMERLQALGFRFGLDDFGMGYSSFSYLSTMPIDTLKIDKSFVQGMGANSKQATIVNAAIQLGKNLGLVVIAEGVETESMLKQLCLKGCQQVQGYFLSHPLPEAKILPFFKNNGLNISSNPI